MFKNVYSLYSAFFTQPAFYSQSAVCILHSVCILPLVCSQQSTVCSLHFTLTISIIIFATSIPDINYETRASTYMELSVPFLIPRLVNVHFL